TIVVGDNSCVTRRGLIGLLPVALLSSCGKARREATVEARDSAPPGQALITQFDASGQRIGQSYLPKVARTEAEWWQMLTHQQFYVTRHTQTDTPFTGTYFKLHDRGLFRCICCENALFSSEAKYDSHTGWPSFWEPIAKENVREVVVAGVPLFAGHEVVCSL